MVGNRKNYDAIDVILVFLKFKDQISRNELKSELSLGEGSVKGILSKLKEIKLIRSTNKGHELTRFGKKVHSQIITCVSHIEPCKLKIIKNMKGKTIQIKKPTNPITYKERDIAIRTGAEAALLFKFEQKLYLAQCEQDLIDTSSLDNVFDLWDGDYLIVTYACNELVCERALINVAISLNNDLKKLIQSLNL